MNLRGLGFGLSFLFFGSVWAGGWTSSGGSAVVCLKPGTQEIQFAYSLDLYEAFNAYGYPSNVNAGPPEQQAVEILGKLERANPSLKYLEAFEDLKTYRKFLTKGVPLAIIDDLGDKVIDPPHGCQFAQAVNAHSDGWYYFNTDIWDALSNDDRAYLLVHETVYAVFRKSGAKDSSLVRKIVGMAFAEEERNMEPVRDGIPKQYYVCSQSGRSTFAVFNNSKYNMYEYWIQFLKIGGLPLVVKALLPLKKIERHGRFYLVGAMPRIDSRFYKWPVEFSMSLPRPLDLASFDLTIMNVISQGTCQYYDQPPSLRSPENKR